MILKPTLDLFKENIYMFSDLKKTHGPMATKVGDNLGGEESVVFCKHLLKLYVPLHSM